MKRVQLKCAGWCLFALSLAGCGGAPPSDAAPAKTAQTVPLKPGDFMRHPAGGPHYDGALNADTWVAIGGYGPTKATVIDGGELFGKSR
jgi:PBP1b-binding outer membrane lipoprotein LpoB